MATVHLFGPYYVLALPANMFKPGDVRAFSFGPWPHFADGTVTISAGIQDFGPGDRRAITVDSTEYSMDRAQRHYVHFTYRNTGSEPIQGWYFNLSVVLP
jgi:hypothetical protein